MSSADEDNNRKGTVEVGSGDFQPNPIYGDKPQSYATTYDENDQNQMNNVQQDQYPRNQDEEYEDDDDDANNPFNEQQQQQQQQQQPQQQEYEQQQQGYDEQQQQQQQQQGYEQQQYGNEQASNPPPPYSEDPPAPPAYSDPNQDTNYENEPEDVVAQMNANNVDNDEDVGDYGVTQPKTEDSADIGDGENGVGLFGNFFIRTVYMASGLFFASMLSFAIWFQDAGGDFSAGYGLSGFAAVLLFIGSIGAMVYAIMKKMNRPIPAENIVLWIIIGFYVIGGLFYFLGGCAVAFAWNQLDASYIAGIFFAEETFVGFHGILAGVDLWKRKFLNNKKWRVIIYNLLFLFVAVVAFFAYAVTSTTIDEEGGDNAGPAFLALFYFLVLIPQILYLVIYLIPKLNETIGKPIVLLILAGAFLFCVVCILIGYFILVGASFGFNGMAYFIGIGVFIVLTGTIIAFDMLFDRFIPGYKDGGASVTDQNGTNGAEQIAMDNPDSD